jgi:Domain of unknown function (DUF4384)
MSETSPCLSEFALDKLMAGELGAEAAAAAREHLAGCTDCTARLAELAADRDAYRAALPAAPARAFAAARPPEVPDATDRPDAGLATGVEAARPAERPRPARVRRAWIATTGVAAAAACLVLLWRGHAVDPGGQPGGEPSTRRKGGPALGFYVSRDGQVVAGSSGAELRPGDLVRLAVTTERPAYLVVGSIDAAGQVTIYHPTNGARAAAIEAGTDRLLPGAVALDDTLGPESVVAFFCAEPVPVADVRAALAAASAVPGCAMDRIEWIKRAR